MRKGNPLLQFFVGIALFALGIYWFTSKVTVSTGFGGFMLGSFRVTGGLVVVPFLVGIVWLFIDFDSLIAKIFTGLGLLVIIASVVANTSFHFRSESLFTYLLILVFICAGMGLIAKVLFAKPEHSTYDEKYKDKKANQVTDNTKKDK